MGAVLHRPRSAIWMVLVTVASCLMVAMFVLPNPVGQAEDVLGNGPKSFGAVTWLDSGSDVEGVSLSITGADFSGQKQELTVLWRNDTADSVTYGEGFYLQKQDNGQWVPCKIRDTGSAFLAFPAIGYFLPPNESRGKAYQLLNYYDFLTPGTYRLVSDFHFDKDIPITKEKVKYLWATFKVGQ